MLITAFAFSAGYASPPTAPTTCITQVQSKQDIVKNWYTSQIGIREATGHNDGPEIKKWLAHYNLTEGYSYCSAFVGYGFYKAGVTTTINAWSPTSVNWKNIIWDGTKLIKKPQSADVISLWSASLKRVSHTGYFDHDINGTVYESVEANTNDNGSFNGDGVYKKKEVTRLLIE